MIEFHSRAHAVTINFYFITENDSHYLELEYEQRFRWFPSSRLGTQSWKLQLPVYSDHKGAQPCQEAATASNPTHAPTS